jgi:hypothetical protein
LEYQRKMKVTYPILEASKQNNRKPCFLNPKYLENLPWPIIKMPQKKGNPLKHVTRNEEKRKEFES